MDQEFINQLAEKLSKLGTKRPLGFHYIHPFGTVPPDSIQCNGAEYNRALYADFFAYANEQGWVKTEAEWQEIASQNNGYCSYYSDGDGSTTFRTPKFAPFQPEATEWMICVVVFGIATNVGSTDVSNVMSAVAQVQAELPNKLNNTTPHIVDTWKDSQGNWYRVWSDGFIEQGYTYAGNPQTNKGIPVAFPTQFSTTTYKVLCETSVTGWSHALNAEVVSGTKSTTGCVLRLSTYNNQDVVTGLSFVAFGY